MLEGLTRIFTDGTNWGAAVRKADFTTSLRFGRNDVCFMFARI